MRAVTFLHRDRYKNHPLQDGNDAQIGSIFDFEKHPRETRGRKSHRPLVRNGCHVYQPMDAFVLEQEDHLVSLIILLKSS